MRSIRLMLLSLAIALAARSAIGAEKAAAAKPAASQNVEVIELAIHPSQPPRPSLKYSLLPGYLERMPGNAVPIYAKALPLLGVKGVGSKEWKEIGKWLGMPLASLPSLEVRKMLGDYSGAIRYIDIAARRDRCDWDPPIREESRHIMDILLPDVQSTRLGGCLVALRTRLQISEKKYDEALASLRTGYSLARHVAEQPFVVSSLVALTMANTMTIQLQELLTRPEVPNLYWAITALPHPLIDLRRPMEQESNGLYLMFPDMQPSKRDTLSAEQWNALAPQVVSTLVELDRLLNIKPSTTGDKEKFLARVIHASPIAKADLIAAGHPKAKVDAMVPAQAVLLDMLEIYEARRDDQFQWFNVPYWQAHGEMKKAAARIAASSKSDDLVFLARMLVPSVASFHLAEARFERRLAALRCVEAIGLYAGAHAGKLPTSLEEIHEVPIPLNPVTGKAFSYRIEGDVAVLESNGPADADFHPQQYRIRVVK